ncbi:MAG: Na+:solute symporter [Candidatus Omnitrophica bacterium]|nr:Na+:solute symporter [Candidatus Omnitrophota bacterium]
MQPLDWIVVAIYCVASLLLGVALTKKASAGIESYFVSDGKLSWWLAGTSMAATAFSSDTPLLVTGIVRQRGIWGNWEIWALGISTMFAVFFFSKLWKRSGVMTEVEFVELRYDGKAAAFLRGFKAIYWGVFYNAFVMGAWPMIGLTKVMQETTNWNKAESIFFCMGLTVIYSCLSGFWGVVLTDFFQFFIAMGGAILLAIFAIKAAGGMEHVVANLQHTDKLAFIPPVHGDHFTWFLGLIFIQWWAWKNSDGGGIIVQRIASCKNEKQAILSVLWFNIAQNALRAWPWILTALASLVLLPDLTDHERAYPRLITQLLPAGLKGLMIASFFAAFMSTISTHLNWGTSYFVNDFYKRFVKRDESEKHYVNVARITSFFLAAAGTGVAFCTDSIGQVFTFVLNLTAAIGPVYLLRWFWWRINPWSEIVALAVGLPVILSRPIIFKLFGIPHILPFELGYMILGSAAFWLPVTFMTKPVSPETIQNFFLKVRPPGFWNGQRYGKITTF